MIPDTLRDAAIAAAEVVGELAPAAGRAAACSTRVRGALRREDPEVLLEQSKWLRSAAEEAFDAASRLLAAAARLERLAEDAIDPLGPLDEHPADYEAHIEAGGDPGLDAPVYWPRLAGGEG